MKIHPLCLPRVAFCQHQGSKLPCRFLLLPPDAQFGGGLHLHNVTPVPSKRSTVVLANACVFLLFFFFLFFQETLRTFNFCSQHSNYEILPFHFWITLQLPAKLPCRNVGSTAASQHTQNWAEFSETLEKGHLSACRPRVSICVINMTWREGAIMSTTTAVWLR